MAVSCGEFYGGLVRGVPWRFRAGSPAAHVLRIDHAGHDQSIAFTARGDNSTSLPATAETLRRLDGVQGVEVAR